MNEIWLVLVGAVLAAPRMVANAKFADNFEAYSDWMETTALQIMDMFPAFAKYVEGLIVEGTILHYDTVELDHECFVREANRVQNRFGR